MASPSPAPVPTVEDVETIAAGAQPILRNLQITLSYSDLSAAVAAFMPVNASWCTFATWASKQAGVTIRNEDMTQIARQRLEESTGLLGPIERLIELVGGSPTDHRQAIADHLGEVEPFRRAADAVARGNKKVYEEIAREFARFLPVIASGRRADASAIDAFCAGLRPGPPPDGQQLLADAFRAYYGARYTTDYVKAAQLVLLANLKVGFHEQTRLQPEIKAAIDAGVDSVDDLQRLVKSSLIDELPFASRVLRFWLPWIRRRYDALVGAIAVEAARVSEEVITEHLMSITLPPARVLPLGRDLDLPVPAALEHLDNADLLALLAPLESASGGVPDWADLHYRMRYIAALFRCEQQDPALLGPPFTDEQIESIRAGTIPAEGSCRAASHAARSAARRGSQAGGPDEIRPLHARLQAAGMRASSAFATASRTGSSWIRSSMSWKKPRTISRSASPRDSPRAMQ